uniref:G-protein coupled receptors family 1 profile domain-containing protein n=1 Tax=Ciona intestinalis TaxID=7719 RepID=H2XRM0_CIOIN
IRLLSISGNRIRRLGARAFFSVQSTLRILWLSNNMISVVHPDSFQGLISLQHLDLSNNCITSLENGFLNELHDLSSLFLNGNNILKVQIPLLIGLRQSFRMWLPDQLNCSNIVPDPNWACQKIQSNAGLYRVVSQALLKCSVLVSLDLTNNKILIIFKQDFMQLSNLTMLKLQANDLMEIESGSFNNLKQLETLDISGNTQVVYDNNLLSEQKKLKRVYGNNFRICCLARKTSPSLLQCSPEDPISSCDRLIAKDYIRALIWIQAFIAIIGNAMVAVLRAREYPKQESRGGKVNTSFVGVLSVADLLMGIYLLMIAVVDSVHQVEFFAFSHIWRHSGFCRFCGFLSLFSAEASVFTLLVITFTRMVSIVSPIYYLRANLRIFRIAMLLAWTVALIISVIPVFRLPNFFSQTSLCLPAFYTSKRDSDWIFSLFVIIFNLVAFFAMVTSYLVIIIATQRSQTRSENRRSSNPRPKHNLGRRVFLIVATDFCCWIPVCILGFVSIGSGGLNFYNDVYPWTAVILLPINSSMNPLIYTFLT